MDWNNALSVTLLRHDGHASPLASGADRDLATRKREPNADCQDDEPHGEDDGLPRAATHGREGVDRKVQHTKRCHH